MKALAGELGRRIACHGRYKLVLLAVLPTLFCLGYFTLQHVTLRPPTTFELTMLDRAIEFSPRWIYVYQSLYLLMPIAPLLATRKGQLRRYTQGYLWLAVAGFLTFLVVPVVSPRPDGVTGVAAFDFLTSYEGKLNAFPSLHAGLAAYTLIFARWAFPGEISTAFGRSLYLSGLLWGGAILYATLATKQHYAVDLPAGIVLAWCSHRWSGITVRLGRSRDQAAARLASSSRERASPGASARPRRSIRAMYCCADSGAR